MKWPLLELEWECPDSSWLSYPDAKSPRFDVTLEDLSCLVGLNQRLALDLTQHAITVQPYGRPGMSVRLPLVDASGSRAFEIERRGLSIRGHLSTDDTSQVHIDEVSLWGVPVCTPGSLPLHDRDSL